MYLKTITTFVGSARKRGLTYAAACQFLDNSHSFGNAQSEIALLSGYNVRLCRGWKSCFDRGEDRFPLKDDRDILLGKTRNSDGVTLAFSSYSFQVSTTLKAPLDRLGFVFHRPCFHGRAFTCIAAQRMLGSGKIVKYLDLVGRSLGLNDIFRRVLFYAIVNPRSPLFGSEDRTLMRNSLFVALLFAGTSLASMARSDATLNIDTAKPVANVSPMLYGIMTEEINHSYDGGLYAELVSNRTFQTNRGLSIENWTLIQNGTSKASIEVDSTTGPSTAIPYSLKLVAKSTGPQAEVGFYNTGFWGMAVRPFATYRGSFYAKAESRAIGGLTIRLVNDTTASVAASTSVPSLAGSWQRYEFTLKTGALAASADYHLEFLVQHSGTAWFSLVSLFPPTYKDEPNGKRIDLMEKLAALHPAFLRFPGGNYVEGDHINERFQWKKTIGPLVDRPTHPTPWTYRSSDGMGLLEFLTWCEDLHMEPLLAVYSGFSLQQEHVAPGKDLEPYIQEALDEIEYVSGDTATRWGAERAKDGHPAPFHLRFVEIGNEEYHDQSGTYDARFAQFYRAIKKVHPELQLVATAPVQLVRPDILDDNDHALHTHFYRTAQQFYQDVHHYDAYDRNGPKILVGEWATREGSPTTNLGAALSDAAWMTGLDRNSDVVIMASYAPLFVNVNPGGMQWPGDLIGFDALNSYGSPSYYAQVMFSSHLGNQILGSKLDTANPRLFESVAYNSKTHHLFIKLVNASSTSQIVEIHLDGATRVLRKATVTTLSGQTTQETNSITEPTRIIPVTNTITNAATMFSYLLPKYSIQVLDVSLE